MSTSKRYSLIVDFGKDYHIIKFKEFNKNKYIEEQKDKVDLSTIDFFTTSFENEEELKEYLDIFLKDIGDLKIDKVIYGENCDEPKDASIIQRNNAYNEGKKIK